MREWESKRVNAVESCYVSLLHYKCAVLCAEETYKIPTSNVLITSAACSFLNLLSENPFLCDSEKRGEVV